MKTHRVSRLPLLLRIFTGCALVSAAAAMAIVAVKTSTSASHARTSVNHSNMLRRDLFETSLGVTRSGEPDPSLRIHNGRAQQAYDDRAYPRKFIESAQQVTAANAAKQIASLTPLLAGPWAPLGPSGVAADALVASESTPATVGTIYSGRTTAIA